MSRLHLIARIDLCDEFKCTPDCIRKWIKHKGFPKPLPCPAREPLFDLCEVKEWVRGASLPKTKGGSQ